MNLKITLSGTKSPGVVEIEAGETILIPVDSWKNADGTARDMSNVTVSQNITRKVGTVYTQVASVAQPDLGNLSVSATVTAAFTPGTYHCEVIESRLGGAVNIGSYSILVLP